MAIRLAVLLGLTALLAWNLTRSSALPRAVESESRGDYPRALMLALDHLDRRPWSDDARRIAARCLSRLDFADQAEPHYQRLRQWTLEDEHYRAYGLVRTNQRERALAAYDAILKRHPGDVTALQRKAGVYLSQSRWNDVKGAARSLIDRPSGPAQVLQPSTVRNDWTLETVSMTAPQVVGHTLMAVASHDDSEPERSVAEFEQVLRLDPGLTLIPLPRGAFWGYYGNDLLSLGRAADVVRLISPVIEQTAEIGLIELVGRAQVQLSDFDAAERTWKHALLLKPDLFTAWLHLGRIELQRGKPEEAIRSLGRAAELRPDSYEAAYSLAASYRRLGNEAEAQKFQEKARRLRAPAADAPATR